MGNIQTDPYICLLFTSVHLQYKSLPFYRENIFIMIHL